MFFQVHEKLYDVFYAHSRSSVWHLGNLSQPCVSKIFKFVSKFLYMKLTHINTFTKGILRFNHFDSWIVFRSLISLDTQSNWKCINVLTNLTYESLLYVGTDITVQKHLKSFWSALLSGFMRIIHLVGTQNLPKIWYSLPPDTR